MNSLLLTSILHIIFSWQKKTKMSYLTGISIIILAGNHFKYRNIFYLHKLLIMPLVIITGFIYTALLFRLFDFNWKIDLRLFLVTILSNKILNIYIIVEEIVWRGIIQFVCFDALNLQIDYLIYLIISLFIGVLFVMSHKGKNVKKKLELFVFSFFLSLIVFLTRNIYWGIGLHLVRNNYIIALKKGGN